MDIPAAAGAPQPGAVPVQGKSARGPQGLHRKKKGGKGAKASANLLQQFAQAQVNSAAAGIQPTGAAAPAGQAATAPGTPGATVNVLA